MARKQIGLALDPELLDRVDEARGLVSRAAWIAAALERALAAESTPGAHYGGIPVGEPSAAVEEASEAEARRPAAATAEGDPAPSPTPAPASPRPSIDELCKKGFVRPAATFSPKANVRPIPKDA